MKRPELKVAEEILGLLGGARHLQMMLGAVSISAVRDPGIGLQVTHLAHHQPSLKVDGFRVLEEQDGRYTVQALGPFYRPTHEEISAGAASWAGKLRASQEPVATRSGVAEERLVAVIEKMTDLALRMPMVRPLPINGAWMAAAG